MRLASGLLVLSAIGLAGPALAEATDPAPSVVVLRGASAPPTPWVVEQPAPVVIEQTVIQPLYYYYPAFFYPLYPAYGRPAHLNRHHK